MHLTDSSPCLMPLQQAINQWVEAAPSHEPQLVEHVRSCAAQLELTVTELQQQLQAEVSKREQTQLDLEQSQCVLQTILDTSTDGFLILDRFGSILNFNRKFAEQWSLSDEVHPPDQHILLEIIKNRINDPQGLLARIQAESDHPDLESQLILEFKDGRIFERDSKPQRLGKHSLGRVIRYRDVTKPQSTEIASSKQREHWGQIPIVLPEAQTQSPAVLEERLRLLELVVVNGNDSVIITEANLQDPRIVYTNAAFSESTGYTAAEVLGKTCRILQGPKTDQVQLSKIRQALTQGKSIQVELIHYRKDGSEFWVDLNIVPIADSQGSLTHYVALQRDITDRKWAEKALLATQARLKYLLSSSPSVIYTCQPNRNRACTFVSENVTQQLGYEVWQYLKDSQFWVDRIHPEDLPGLLVNLSQLFTAEQLSCEYRFLHQNGSYRWLRDGMKLLHDRQGQPVEIIGSVVDITDHKRAENQIRESLQEKEVMLKEIHHRVKNNLQVISSLLKLQAGYIKDDRILEVFKESQNRVRAMALIHEKLYQSEDLAKTNFAEYIRSLVTDLFRSYSVSSRLVHLHLDVEDVRLSIDTAIPCGLIINELISNSLKYAFPAGQSGEISVSLHLEAPDRYLLVVRDNGCGLPANLDFRKTKSLGLQLVCSLTKQLQGAIDLKSEDGAVFKITFADQKQKN